MEIDIKAKKENQLLKRTEIRFVLHHPNAATPKRDSVREELSKALKVPKDRIVVDNMEPSFGVHDTAGYAKIYPSKEDALAVEREYLLVRNHLAEKKGKKGAAEPAKEA